MGTPSGEDILAVIEKICCFGPRWMGSPGAEQAAEYIFDQFKVAGLNVERQPFQYLSYTPKRAVLSVNGQKIPCEPIAMSRSTKGELEAPLVFGGQCLEEDFDRLSAQGVDISKSIIVSENLRSFVAYPFAEVAGALGLISATTLPGNVIRCGCARLDRKPGHIPAVAIGGSDGRSIVRDLEKGYVLTASIDLEGESEEKQGHNVVAKMGDCRADRILITAHYDSFWNGIHAMDNAAGSATAIILSRILAKDANRNLEFVVFGGEELGCWGSWSYVKEYSSSLDAIKAVINLDTFGSNRSQVEIGATPDMVTLCRTTAEERKTHIDCWNVPPRPASDQQSFVEKGVPAIWLANCGADQRYHTPLDVPSEMSRENLEAIAGLSLAFIMALSGS